MGFVILGSRCTDISSVNGASRGLLGSWSGMAIIACQDVSAVVAEVMQVATSLGLMS
jgi:hypothetical protein